MKSIIIARGQHPFELSSITLARRVEERLRQMPQYSVKSIRMPFELSFVAYLLRKIQRIDGIETRPLHKLEDERSWEWSRTILHDNPDSIIFNFHNSPYTTEAKPVEEFGFSEYEWSCVTEIQYMESLNEETSEPLNGYAIEIPAIYRPVANQELIWRLAVLEEHDLSYRNLIKIHSQIVDQKATREAGLMSDRIVDIITRGIEGLVAGYPDQFP